MSKEVKWVCLDDYGTKESVGEDDFQTVNHKWFENDFLKDEPILRQVAYQQAAEQAAEMDLDQSGGELSDPGLWPRKYLLRFEDEEMTLSVDMDYSPDFFARTVE